MDQTFRNQTRVLAVALTTRGFGYSVFEGENRIVAFGCKRAKGESKNIQSVSQLTKLLEQFRPNILALQNVNCKESRRVLRIKKLHQEIINFAQNEGVKVRLFTGQQLRKLLLNDSKGTKHAMGEVVAKLFPIELGEKLPAKRRAWEKEHEWMSVFDSAGLAIAFWMTGKRPYVARQ